MLDELIDFKKQGGLVPAIVQDVTSGEVLMLAYMSPDSLAETLKGGKACYFSRSRRKLWLKGATSGHQQLVREVLIDCDADTILLKVEQLGPGACHTGHRSCFFRKLEGGKLTEVGERAFDPKEVYG